MLATVPSATLLGVEGRPVRVEVHVSKGLPGFTVVGLPDTTCREARDRVRAALLVQRASRGRRAASRSTWPRRALRKVGAGLDLPSRSALLAASEQVPAGAWWRRAFVGELGPRRLGAARAGGAAADRRPDRGRGRRARRVHGRGAARRVATSSGRSPRSGAMVRALAGRRAVARARRPRAAAAAAAGARPRRRARPARRPGTRSRSRRPAATTCCSSARPARARRCSPAACRAAARPRPAPTRSRPPASTPPPGLPLPPGGLVRRPPFRAPHHGASAVSLVGGGSGTLQPGEISLAHRGVLFLDELGEFDPTCSTPCASRSRRASSGWPGPTARSTFPARLLLVGAMNPCPCGEGGRPGGCRCTPAAPGPLRAAAVGPAARPLRPAGRGRPARRRRAARRSSGGEPTAAVAARVAAARARGGRAGRGRPTPSSRRWRLDDVARARRGPPAAASSARSRAGRLTGRGLGRVRRVARTIADLAGPRRAAGGRARQRRAGAARRTHLPRRAGGMTAAPDQHRSVAAVPPGPAGEVLPARGVRGGAGRAAGAWVRPA